MPSSCKMRRHILLEDQLLHSRLQSLQMLMLIELSVPVITAPAEWDMPDFSNRDSTVDGCAL